MGVYLSKQLQNHRDTKVQKYEREIEIFFTVSMFSIRSWSGPHKFRYTMYISRCSLTHWYSRTACCATGVNSSARFFAAIKASAARINFTVQSASIIFIGWTACPLVLIDSYLWFCCRIHQSVSPYLPGLIAMRFDLLKFVWKSSVTFPEGENQFLPFPDFINIKVSSFLLNCPSRI